MSRYTEAKEIYVKYGIDTDKAIKALKNVPVALHCWQGDDVRGFDQKVDSLSGGIQTTGNYPTEVVSDKIPALLAFFPEIALHVTRPIRWDSDHVVLLDDETKEICKEIVRCGGLDGSVKIALDYFDASINRVSAWTVGLRNTQKALLMALLNPTDKLTKLQNENNWTELMVLGEELKTLPFGDVWAEYCKECGAPLDGEWFDTVKQYEKEIQSKRA